MYSKVSTEEKKSLGNQKIPVHKVIFPHQPDLATYLRKASLGDSSMGAF
jgi:hypothetical protein